MSCTVTIPMPELDRLFDLLYVDSTSPSGLRYAKAPRRSSKRAGDVAGTGSGKYWKIMIDGTTYGAHRIIQKMKTGEDHTDLTVDHKDRDHRNNHPFNLRWATWGSQARNRSPSNSMGYMGVAFHKRGRARPYRAQAWDEGRRRTLGYFATAEEAHAAYLNFQKENT